MYRSRSSLIVLGFLISLGAVKPAVAFEDSSSGLTGANTSSSSQSSQESNVLRRVAIALPEGSEAMRALRGSPLPDDNRDRLQPSIPGMDCGIDRVLSYVSCYSRSIDNEKEAENAFTRLNDHVRAALASDSWQPVESIPMVGSIRNISYIDSKSGAQIDVELIIEAALDTQSYIVSLYGWTGTSIDPRF